MEKQLSIANGLLLFSVLAFLLTIGFAYPFSTNLSLGLKILAHLGIMFFAIGIKLSYVFRLYALKKMGQPLH